MYERLQRASHEKERSACIERETMSRERLPVQRHKKNTVRHAGSIEPAGGTIQREGEEQEVLGSEDVQQIKRGNYAEDIMKPEATGEINGLPYFLVPQIRKILDRIHLRIYEMAISKKQTNEKDVANKLVDNMEECEPFIHAMVVQYLKVGNCLDFAEVIFSKLVGKGYKKWIYECCLERMVQSGNSHGFFNVIFSSEAEGNTFDIANNATYGNALIRDGGKKIGVAAYLQKHGIQGPCKEGAPKHTSLGYSQKYTYTIPMWKNDLDHAFVITSAEKVEDAGQLNPDEALVVDGWLHVPVMSLGEYLSVVNLKIEEVKLQRSHPSDGLSLSLPWLQSVVEEEADKAKTEALAERKSERGEQLVAQIYRNLKAVKEGKTVKENEKVPGVYYKLEL